MAPHFSRGKTKETVLAVGRKVRLLQDHVTLEKGAEGVVHSGICWAGQPSASGTFSFRNGDTMFNQSPEKSRASGKKGDIRM
jgi:hypothetical protein